LDPNRLVVELLTKKQKNGTFLVQRLLSNLAEQV